MQIADINNVLVLSIQLIQIVKIGNWCYCVHVCLILTLGIVDISNVRVLLISIIPIVDITNTQSQQYQLYQKFESSTIRIVEIDK